MVFNLDAFAEKTQLFYLIPGDSINTWKVQSITGSLFTVRQRPSFSDLIIEYTFTVPSISLNSYTIGKIADTACRLGLGMSRPFPLKIGVVSFSVKRPLYSDTLNQKVLESELANFSTAIETIEAYLEKIKNDAELISVDISMWQGIDLEITDITQMIERRYLTYSTWEEFADTVIESEMDDEFKEKMVAIISACQEFEDKNEHLCLAEISIELLMLIEQSQEHSPNELEIN